MSTQEEGAAAASVPDGAVSTGQTDTNNNKIPEIAIPVEERDFILSNDDIEKLRSLDEAFQGDQLIKLTTNPLIQRVPSTLCIPKDFRKYFKPRVISIGPIHHGDPALHGSEQLKLRLAAYFMKNIGVKKENLYNAIKTEIGSLKECYDPKEVEPYDDDKLAWMLFLDGCAILQAILQGDEQQQQPNGANQLSKLKIKNDLLTFVYLDLFLLENQLPLRVLRLLTSSDSGKVFTDSVKRFIDKNVITPAEMKEEQQQHDVKGEVPVHLLDLLRRRLIFKKENRGTLMQKLDRIFRKLKGFRDDRGTKRPYSHTFRNVKELRNAGIWLKPSSSSCLTDVRFSRECCRGKLWLPPITVDDSTGPKFMNLIAYEMCPDFENDFTVTSYICFLDSLIDEAEDVKELRDAGILYNGMGSDEEVAKLFNKMNTDLVPSQTIYSDVKTQVQDHCRNMWINYAAQAYYTHFNSPWTFLAFVGAIAALLLSALQTNYTMNPVKDDDPSSATNCTCLFPPPGAANISGKW